MANDHTYWENIARDVETGRNNALRAREEEQEALLRRKEQTLKDNTGHINRSFDAQFDPGFYDQYATSLVNLWRPDIDRQYGDAQRKLNFTFARQQPGGGSVGAEAFGRLKEAYDRSGQMALDSAQTKKGELRSSIEGQRSSLLGSVTSDTDPGAVVSNTANVIGNIPRTPTYSPLGDLFSNLTGQFAVAQQARNQGYPGWGFSVNGGGSGRRDPMTIIN